MAGKKKGGTSPHLSRDELLGKLAHLNRFRRRHYQRIISAVGDQIGHEVVQEALQDAAKRRKGLKVPKIARTETAERLVKVAEFAADALRATDLGKMKKVDDVAWLYEGALPLAGYQKRKRVAGGQARAQQRRGLAEVRRGLARKWKAQGKTWKDTVFDLEHHTDHGNVYDARGNEIEHRVSARTIQRQIARVYRPGKV